jgi:3-deoxy-D-manno-octulosonic-acid transferase
MDKFYRAFSIVFAPFVPLWLTLRKMKGKEDASRFHERFGIASAPRPLGTLIWIHAASIGEANSVLALIGKMRERFPDLHILLTTGTVTSAQLMDRRLPKGVTHQYVPVDTPEATGRFMRFWRPDIAVWVESEFWPNLVRSANDWECFMGVINARMSKRSFAFWKRAPSFIARMLSCFDFLFAQSEDDKARLLALGAREVECLGNIKYDSELLPCNESDLLALRTQIGERPLWLAASTHPGEEGMVAAAHELLAATRGSLLTVIVPRHPERGKDIAAELAKTHSVALRSRKDAVTPKTSFYIADTLGELGLFYRLCDIAFMGGSLVEHGGQNPLEPARLACAILTGPHTGNFHDIFLDMERSRACLRVKSPESLASQVDMLLNNPSAAQAIQAQAKQWVESQSGASDRLLAAIGPIFSLPKKA